MRTRTQRVVDRELEQLRGSRLKLEALQRAFDAAMGVVDVVSPYMGGTPRAVAIREAADRIEGALRLKDSLAQDGDPGYRSKERTSWSWRKRFGR